MTIVCEPNPEAARLLATVIGKDVRIVPALSKVPLLLGAATGRCPVVIGATVGLDEALSFTIQLIAKHPSAAVILARDHLVAAEVGRAEAAGVHAVVEVAAHDQIVRACSAAVRPWADGQVFAVFAAKGGCGKTTVATNLAVALRRWGNDRVCLLDLDLEAGDIASVLNLDPKRTLAQLAGTRSIGRLLDAGDLVTRSPATGLDCILAPEAPGEAERIRPARIGGLLRGLVTRYDAIVIDLPARFSPVTLAALDHAHHHIVVATPERPALKNLRVTLGILDLLGYTRSVRSVLLNRSHSGAGITAAEVAAAVRGPVAAHLPLSGSVSTSINHGVPLLADRPGHSFGVAIERFAGRYAPKPARVS
jgi:pilus assembly protein CpaE